MMSSSDESSSGLDEDVVEEETSNSDDSEAESDEDQSDSELQKKTNSTNKGENKKAPFVVAGVLEKYEKLKGKQLFILFPNKLPRNKSEFEKMVTSLNSRIIKAIQPRQKSSRYCLIQFANEEERKKSMIELKSVEVDGKKLIVKIPKTDDEDYINKIATGRAAKNLKQREKLKLKKIAKLEAKKKSFTGTVIVSNIPSSATVADIKKLFPEAVDLRFTCAKGVENTSSATVSLPSPRDATNAFRKKLKIDGNPLKISFAVTNKNLDKKKKKKKNKSKNTVDNKADSNETTNVVSTKKRKLDKQLTEDDDKLPNKKSKQMKNGKKPDGKNSINIDANKNGLAKKKTGKIKGNKVIKKK